MARLRELLQPLLTQWNAARSRVTALRDRGNDLWARLTPRDQQLMSWAGSAIGAVTLVLTIYFAAGHLAKLRHDIDLRGKQLALQRVE